MVSGSGDRRARRRAEEEPSSGASEGENTKPQRAGGVATLREGLTVPLALTMQSEAVNWPPQTRRKAQALGS